MIENNTISNSQRDVAVNAAFVARLKSSLEKIVDGLGDLQMALAHEAKKQETKEQV